MDKLPKLCDSLPKEKLFWCSVAREKGYGFLKVKVASIFACS
ncbi:MULTISPECIES: hypothetical protein [Clostridium]|nr:MULTISPECIES: hypothetical protein [Clostridium]